MGVRYESSPNAAVTRATLALDLRAQPGKILVRFRHPEKKPIRSVTVNGQAHTAFDVEKGDVDISGLSGSATVESRY